MSHSIDLADHGMVALSRSALGALRIAFLREAGPSAAGALQEAGYAGGDTVFGAFRDWLRERGAAEPDVLSVGEFEALAAAYFHAAGWGSITIGSLGDTVATVDCDDWGEADPAAALDHPACHLTTGLFANFFGHVSDAPLAVLEVECRSMGAPRCRFLLGSHDILARVYEEMERGAGYEEAAAGTA